MSRKAENRLARLGLAIMIVGMALYFGTAVAGLLHEIDSNGHDPYIEEEQDDAENK